jgi:hypothetical protein
VSVRHIFSCSLTAISISVMALNEAVAAQPAPVEDARGGESGRPGQYRAGVAYRALQQAQYEAKLAEQDYVNIDAAYKSAQKNADDLRQQSESARKQLEAARQRVAETTRSYEKEVSAVDASARK